MDNNIFGRTSRMKITYMLHENVIYIYKSWFFYFSHSLRKMYLYIERIYDQMGSLVSMLWQEEKNIHDIANPKSNAKIQNPPTLYNKTILALIP